MPSSKHDSELPICFSSNIWTTSLPVLPPPPTSLDILHHSELKTFSHGVSGSTAPSLLEPDSHCLRITPVSLPLPFPVPPYPLRLKPRHSHPHSTSSSLHSITRCCLDSSSSPSPHPPLPVNTEPQLVCSVFMQQQLESSTLLDKEQMTQIKIDVVPAFMKPTV